MEKAKSGRNPETSQPQGGIVDKISDLFTPDVKIYDLLKKDHRKVDALFAELEKTSDEDVERRKELFVEIREELLVHTDAEQKVFYDFLKREDSAHSDVLEAQEEHKLVKTMLADMGRLSKSSDVFMAKVHVLKELVQHHVREEETKLFSDAKSCLDSTQEEELAKRFQQAKERLLNSH